MKVHNTLITVYRLPRSTFVPAVDSFFRCWKSGTCRLEEGAARCVSTRRTEPVHPPPNRTRCGFVQPRCALQFYDFSETEAYLAISNSIDAISNTDQSSILWRKKYFFTGKTRVHLNFQASSARPDGNSLQSVPLMSGIVCLVMWLISLPYPLLSFVWK